MHDPSASRSGIVPSGSGYPLSSLAFRTRAAAAGIEDMEQRATRSAGAGRRQNWAPLKLADAERIASGHPLPLSPQPQPQAECASGHGGPIDSREGEILELPEPMQLRPFRRSPAPGPAPDLAPVDYTSWSAALDDLLKRPIEEVPPVDSDGATKETSSHAATTPETGVAPAKRSTARATWMPIVVLCILGALVGGVIGGAAYGLAMPETKSWMFGGVVQLIDRLQEALSL